MERDPLVRVLLVEDDEEDFLITRDLFSEIRGSKFALGEVFRRLELSLPG